MSLLLDLTRNANLHTIASGNTIDAQTANAFVDKYSRHFGAEYEQYKNQWRSRLSVTLFRSQLLTGAKLEKVADMLMEKEYGMDPALAAYMKGHVLIGTDMFPLITEDGQAFTPRVFMMNVDKLNMQDTRRAIHRVAIGQHDYRRAIELDGKTSSHSSGTGHFTQMFNPLGNSSPDGARIGLVLGYRPRFQFNRNKTAAVFSKKEMFRCHLTIIFGQDLDMLMRLVDVAGETVRSMYVGEHAYFATPGTFETQEVNEDIQRELVRSLTTSKASAPLKQSLGDKLQGVAVAIESSASSTSAPEEEHVSDSASEIVSSDGDEAATDEAGSESESSSASSDDASSTRDSRLTQPMPLTSKQQRMFRDSEEKKRNGSKTTDASA